MVLKPLSTQPEVALNLGCQQCLSSEIKAHQADSAYVNHL